MWCLLWKECFCSKNVSCTQFSARNISSLNTLKVWKLCKYIYFIGNVFIIISNAILCHVVFSFSQLISWIVFTISASLLLLFMCKTPKSDLTHNYNNKQYNSVLKVVWKYVTKIQALHNSVEMLFLIWMWWLCSGVQQLPTTTESIITLKASIPTCYLVF